MVHTGIGSMTATRADIVAASSVRPGGLPAAWRTEAAPVPYLEALAAMDARAAAIAAGTADELVWLIEHPPLYTAGTSARPEDLLDQRFPVYTAGRGGQLTYHGPGQRVAYVMLDLRQRGADVRPFVATLAEWLIRTLAPFHLPRHPPKHRAALSILR